MYSSYIHVIYRKKEVFFKCKSSCPLLFDVFCDVKKNNKKQTKTQRKFLNHLSQENHSVQK